MYTLQVTVRESVGAHLFRMAISEQSDDGRSVGLATHDALLEPLDLDEDPLVLLIEATARYLRKMSGNLPRVVSGESPR